MWKLSLRLLQAVLLLLLGGSPGSGLTVKMLTHEQLAKQAEVIVLGTVLSAYSDIDAEKGHICTFVNIRAGEYLKGKDRPRTLTLKTIGGIMADKGMYVDGAADFYRNEEVMLFLARRSDGSLFPVGFFLGKFSVYRDVETGRKVLIREADGKGRYFSTPRNETIEGLTREEKLFFDDFRVKVQTSAAEATHEK